MDEKAKFRRSEWIRTRGFKLLGIEAQDCWTDGYDYAMSAKEEPKEVETPVLINSSDKLTLVERMKALEELCELLKRGR